MDMARLLSTLRCSRVHSPVDKHSISATTRMGAQAFGGVYIRQYGCFFSSNALDPPPPPLSLPDRTMPFRGRISESLFRASLYLLFIVISFTAMAIPVITQEFARAPSSSNPESSKLTHKEIFDIVFGIRE